MLLLKIICITLAVSSIISIAAVIILTQQNKTDSTVQPTDIIPPDPRKAPTTIDGVIYSYDAQYNGMMILDYIGNAAEVVIPNEIAGYPVISIGATSFSGSTSITAITIPESVIYIGAYAFNGCSNLQTMTCMSTDISLGLAIFGIGQYFDDELSTEEEFNLPNILYSPGQSELTDLANKLKCTVLNLDGEPIPFTPESIDAE